MKRWLLVFGLLTILSVAGAARADGLIIVEDPNLLPGPVPRPHLPPLPPWHRPHPFAPLEITYHQVKVQIHDQVATTTVNQEFYNPNDRLLEGVYLFPLPAGAQIDKFTMQIGGKTVAAELLSADKARQIYEDIVRKMKDPALLEYAGRDVFKVRVFPIEPRASKHITLSYSQILRADAGLIQYTYPLNTEKFSAQPIKTVSLSIDITTSRSLQSIYSPTHSVEIRRHGNSQADVGFQARNTLPETDFQLFYSLEKDRIGLNVLPYRTRGDDGFFLLLATPRFTATANEIAHKDVVFVLDTSGSMAGKKLDQAKKALLFCVENLRADDRFDLVRFSTETEPLFGRFVAATPEHRDRAAEFIKNLKPIGGTAIDDVLTRTLALRSAADERPLTIIFLTDGRPTVGITDENQIVAHVADRAAVAGQPGNARIFCFGIGTDVNTHLLDKIAEATKAFSQYVLPEEDLELKISSFFSKISEPVLTDIKLVFPESAHARMLYPATLPDLYRGEQLIVMGRYATKTKGDLILEGKVNGEVQRFVYSVQLPEAAEEHDFIPRLWATRRIGYLLEEIRLHGENSELKDEITDLARQYGVVTPYTAYLIMEDETHRQVPLEVQSLPQLREDRAARELTGQVWRDSQREKSGGVAVASARYGLAMKSAASPAEAITAGNAEAQRGLSFLSSPPGAPSRPDSQATAGRIAQYTQQIRYIQGRTFFQNGEQWVDARIQKMPGAKPVRLQFNSPEYFDLLSQNPQARSWFALGSQLQLVINGTVCLITE